jgi:hypothetical protein
METDVNVKENVRKLGFKGNDGEEKNHITSFITFIIKRKRRNPDINLFLLSSGA